MEKNIQARSSTGMKTFYHKILIFLIITSAITFFFLRLFYPKTSIFMIPDFGESDVLHFHLPLKEILSQSLKNNTWPLWTPYIGGGFPILAEGQISTFYLPNLIAYKFLPTVIAYNINLVIVYILLASGTYLFTRSWKLGIVPSFFAAMVFTFCGYFSVHLNHYDILQTASLLPLIFWASHRIWLRPDIRNSVLFSFFLSQQIFAGYMNITFITFVGVILFWVCLMFLSEVKKPAFLGKKLFFIFLSFFIGSVLSAIQLIPTLEIWKLSSKSSGVSFEIATNFPYPFKHFLSFINPYIFGSPADATYHVFGYDWGIFWENTAYIGIIPLILALISLIFVKDKRVKIFLMILLISFLIVLGRFSPFYFIFSFPPFNFFRVPSKFLLLSAFSLSILSAYTLEKIINYFSKNARGNKKIFITITFILFVSVIVLSDEYRFSYNYPPISDANQWMIPSQSAKIINTIIKSDRIFTIGAPNEWNKIFLKRGWQNMSDFAYMNNNLYPNYNLLHSFSTPDLNMGGLIPRRIGMNLSYINNIEIDENLKVATIAAVAGNAISLAGVKYIISPYALHGMDLVKINTISAPSPNLPVFNIYENRQSYPSSYIAYKSIFIETAEDALRNLTDDEFADHKSVLAEDKEMEINSPADSQSLTEVIKSSNDEFIFRTISKSRRILVNSVTNYPGWQATIDGKPVNIFTVNLYQQGVPIDEGIHTVRLYFKSDTFELGKKITIWGSFIIFLIVFLSRAVFPHKASGNKRL